MWDSLFPAQSATAEKVQAALPFKPEPPPNVGVWTGAGKGSGLGLMKSFAETGRSAAMAAAVPALLVDSVTERASSAMKWHGVPGVPEGTNLADKVFGGIDEIFTPAVKYWEADPEQVGMAGQILGGLAGMGAKAMTGGVAGIVAGEQMNTSIELANKGASPFTVVVGGAAHGAATAVGLKIPVALGSGRLTSAALGATINPVVGVVDRQVLHGFLQSEGLHAAAEEYKPLDPVQLSVDAIFGGGFGLALGGKVKAPKPKAPGVIEQAPVERLPLLREAAQTTLLHEETQRGRLAPTDPFLAEQGSHLNAAAEARAIAGDAPMAVHPDTPLDGPALKEAQDRAAGALRDATATEGHLFAVQDIPTTDAVQQAMHLVGDAEFMRRADARIAAHKGDLPHGESTLIEAEARAILAQDRAAKGLAEPLTTEVVSWDDFVAAQRGGAETPKAEPPKPTRPPEIDAAQRALEQVSMAGKSLREIIDGGTLAPAERNLAIGLSEAQGNANRAARLLDDFTRTVEAQPSRSRTDVAADVVDAARTGRTVTPEPNAGKVSPEVEAARLATAERPDMVIPVGQDEKGNTISRRASDALADVEHEMAQAQNDAKAFVAAANCFLRG